VTTGDGLNGPSTGGGLTARAGGRPERSGCTTHMCTGNLLTSSPIVCLVSTSSQMPSYGLN
jgi:hypothetical protein